MDPESKWRLTQAEAKEFELSNSHESIINWHRKYTPWLLTILGPGEEKEVEKKLIEDYIECGKLLPETEESSSSFEDDTESEENDDEDEENREEPEIIEEI